VIRLRGERDTVHTRRVHDVTEHVSRGTIDHHHVRPARHENAPGARFGGHIVGASVAANVPLDDLEVCALPTLA